MSLPLDSTVEDVEEKERDRAGSITSSHQRSTADIESAPELLSTSTSTPTPGQSRSLAARAVRAILAVPGVQRSIRVFKIVLGPSHRTHPRPPQTSLTFSLTVPGRRGNVGPTAVDTLVVRASRRLRLHYLLVPFLLLWTMGFILLVREQYYLPSSPSMIDCDAAMWADWPPDSCGVNGTDCADTLVSAYYRCPGGCNAVNLGNPRWIGNDQVDSIPVIIGGRDSGDAGADGVYRADSWVCASGVHAGLVSTVFGGCVAVNPLPYPSGSFNYSSSLGGAGLVSIPFAPLFPGAFTLSPTPFSRGCIEYHWIITSYNVACLFFFTLFLSPPPWVLASTLVILGYFQIVLVSDVPDYPPDWSSIFGGLPAVLFASYWAWRVSLRRTLEGFANAQLPLETAFWQGIGYWLGIESSTVFDKLPISTLGYGGLSSAGVITIVIIVVLIAIVVCIQAWEMRQYGLLRYYILRYLPLVPILIILANLGNSLVLRLHHYLFALAGLPVLSLPNRISLFGQAFCLGLFLDGVGRWGWDSIVETVSELIGDANTGSAVPVFLNSTAAIVSWTPLNTTYIDAGIDGFALLFDDLLHAVNYTASNFSIHDVAADLDLTIDHYLRIAYLANGTSLDYSDPVTWSSANQTWQTD